MTGLARFVILILVNITLNNLTLTPYKCTYMEDSATLKQWLLSQYGNLGKRPLQIKSIA